MKQVRSLRAKLVLLAAVLKNIVIGLALRMVGKRRGAQRWLAALARESLMPTPPEQWDLVEETSRCIGCGLCDAVAAGGEVSSWITGAARRPQDAALAMSAIDSLENAAVAIAAICPVQVSVHGIVSLVRRRAAQLRGVA